MKTRPNGKVQISLLIHPESNRLLRKLAREMNLKRNEAFEVLLLQSAETICDDPHRLARIETKLDDILEWL